MGASKRTVIDLRSQDLDISDLESFRDGLKKKWGPEGGVPAELIMFSSSHKPYQFESLEEFRENAGSIPDNAAYFYYTISYAGGDRCSLYLDPDRPGKVVIEGSAKWINFLKDVIETHFPKGGKRYKIHNNYGILMIWGAVILLAVSILAISSIFIDLDAVVFSVVIFTSSVLGIYLSIVKAKELQPANTISFVRKRRFWLQTFLHLLTIILGIVSAVLASVIVQKIV